MEPTPPMPAQRAGPAGEGEMQALIKALKSLMMIDLKRVGRLRLAPRRGTPWMLG
jgi:hypothetical protein